jgi:hypothetical protein
VRTFVVEVPVGQLIRVRVAVVQKPPLLTDELARAVVGLSLVDARGVVAQQLLVHAHSRVDVRSLRDGVHVLVVDPAVPERGGKEGTTEVIYREREL